MKLSLSLIVLASCLAGCQEPAKPTQVVPTASAATATVVASASAAPENKAEPKKDAPLPALTKSGTKITWYGHAAFRIDTPGGKVLFVDPWITNPKNPTGKDDLAKIDKADLVLVTHGHSDHVGDAVAIGKKTKAKLVTTVDLGKSMVANLGYPKDQLGFDAQGNVGGTVSLLDGEVAITFVPAVHSSGVDDEKGVTHQGGNPGGFVIAVKNGPAIYHTGDTDVFNDMALIPKYQPITVMLACIGDHFVMGPDRAADAVAMVRPGLVVPMHYGTFPVLTGTPDAFDAALKKRGVGSELRKIEPHAVIEL